MRFVNPYDIPPLADDLITPNVCRLVRPFMFVWSQCAIAPA